MVDENEKFVSISTNPKAFKASYHLYFKRTPAPRSVVGFADLITRNVWSPIVWAKGQKRKQDNFDRCDYIALDIDDGWSIEEAKTWTQDHGYSAMIATSKSHQIPKDDKPACDRFRVIMPMEKTIKDLELYRYNMKELMKLVPCDKATKDGARFFFPCKELVFHNIADKYPVLAFPEDYVKDSERKKIRQIRNKRLYQTGAVPRWIAAILTSGPPPGWTRNNTIFRVATTLAELGWEFDAIKQRILWTPYLNTLSCDEIERTIVNGQTKAKG